MTRRDLATQASSSASADNLLDFDTFTWRHPSGGDGGYKINCAVSKSREDGSLDVLLVHGFGASIGHFKKNVRALVEAGHNVHALDLLGFGASQKPLDFQYTMEGWRDLLVDYIEAMPKGKGLVIMGNSIGSLAALLTAKEVLAQKGGLKGVVLLNCAGGMNNAATLDDDWRIKLAYPIFALINTLLKIRPVAQFLFDKFSSKESIENVLRQVYRNQESVDSALVDLIYEPATTPGALEAFVSILTGPPGPRPEKVVPDLLENEVPLLVLWGDRDPFTPLDGPVAQFFQSKLEPEHDFVDFVVLPDVGHCPHDDRPEEVHKALVPWLNKL